MKSTRTNAFSPYCATSATAEPSDTERRGETLSIGIPPRGIHDPETHGPETHGRETGAAETDGLAGSPNPPTGGQAELGVPKRCSQVRSKS